MYPSPTSAPSPDATPVPIGRRTALNLGSFGIAFAALAVLGMVVLVKTIADPARIEDPLKALATGLILLLLFGISGGLLLRGAWKSRRTAISTDYAGLWLTDGTASAVIAWNDVAAIGLHELVHNAQGFSYSTWSIELRLHEPLDPGDPILDRFVLPADPPRYMIRLPRGTHIDAMAAVRARVPELWLEAPDPD